MDSKIREQGKQMCLLKQGKDPIPAYKGRTFLPHTHEYRLFMEGWAEGLLELMKHKTERNEDNG